MRFSLSPAQSMSTVLGRANTRRAREPPERASLSCDQKEGDAEI